MTAPASPPARVLAAAALAFALTLALLTLLQRGEPSAAPPAVDTGQIVRGRAGDAASEIRRLQAAIRAEPRRTALHPQLAAAYLQRARETGDPSFYARADGLLRRAPASAAAAVERGHLALARHDFAGALALAREARRRAPAALAPYPLLVDALVELGRYDDAVRALQRLIDRKPTLAGYARVSYLRELHGDLPGAAEALELAVSAGGPARESVASVQTLLGELQLARGEEARAAETFTAALEAVPGHLPAAAGRARLAAARGELGTAIRRWRAIVARRPLPEYAIALGEAELAAGRPAAARRDLALVRAQQALLGGAGVNTDVEFALFEADHGAAARGVALARRAWAAAPSVRSADALGWALTRAGRPRAGLAWAHRALRLGSLDAGFRFHAGMTALAARRHAEARRHLMLALRHGLQATPWRAQRAARALARTARGA
jgi:tetratricopeptide (TPR) repeat protein